MAASGDDTVRLPSALMELAREWAERDAVPLEDFVAKAVMDRIAAREAAFFARRRQRADLAAFDRILARVGNEPARPDDIIPAD